MKIKRFIETFNDRISTYHYTEEKKVVTELFWNIWGTKLNMDLPNIVIYYPKTEPMFSIIMSVKKKISENTLDDFNELFNMLKRLKAKFNLNDNQLLITINDLIPLIEELTLISNSKKFNI